MDCAKINCEPKPAVIKKKNINKKVTLASVAGSAAGIAGALGGIYLASRKNKTPINFKNYSYSEGDVLLIGAGSVLGGLAGGLISDDKKNIKSKLREASQQFVGSMVFPIGILAGVNKLIDNYLFKSSLNFSSTQQKVIKVLACVASLISGMELGNKVMNMVNNKIFKEEVKHDVRPEDYLVHTDDLCLCANMLLKDFKSVSAITSKLLPLSFIIAGSKTGVQQSRE